MLTKLQKAIKIGGEIKTLTEVQARSLAPGIAGKDILAKSNTGSGKTLAFLLVGIERIVSNKGPDPKTSFPIVILTPVTDLAVQIMQVAKQFAKYHDMEVDLVIGGTDEAKDIKRLTKNRIDILVATPGRFKSILNQSLEIKKRLSLCQTFVIDEADKMTDPGFLSQTKFIHTLASNKAMQTLMFSATMDKTTLTSLGLLKPSAVFIDAAEGTKPQVNTKVRQVGIITDISNHLDALVSVIKEQIKDAKQVGGNNATNVKFNVQDNKLSAPSMKALKEWEMKSLSGYRVMIFLPSNAFIDYIAQVFKEQMPSVNTFTLHGGMQQNARTKTSEAFRTTSNCVMFTSDASARGVDYPDVSCVIQLGFDSRSEYLQRVGRTGRAGKDGTSYLITAPEENAGVELVCDVLNEVHIDKTIKDKTTLKCNNKTLISKIYQSSNIKFPKPTADAKKALRGWLGSLASKWKRLKIPPSSVINMAQSLSVAMGLGEMPIDKLYEKLSIKIKKP